MTGLMNALSGASLGLIVMQAALGLVQCLVLIALILMFRQVRQQTSVLRDIRKSGQSTEAMYLEILQMILRSRDAGQPASGRRSEPVLTMPRREFSKTGS